MVNVVSGISFAIVSGTTELRNFIRSTRRHAEFGLKFSRLPTVFLRSQVREEILRRINGSLSSDEGRSADKTVQQTRASRFARSKKRTSSAGSRRDSLSAVFHTPVSRALEFFACLGPFSARP